MARQALKTLLEDKRYDYIETGSLATIIKDAPNILIPSEEYPLNVYPLDYEEFLWAKGDTFSFEIIKEHYQTLKPFGEMEKQFMKDFREYILVGGMPQAIDAFIETKDFGRVDFVKQNILSLYESDIGVQKEENPTYIKNIIEHIPSELSKHDKTYIISHVDPNARLREYKGPIGWLNEAMIVNISENVNDPSVAINLSTIDPSFKCYLMDTGLLISLAYKNKDYLENDLYEKILFDKLHVNEGMIIENVIAQAIRSHDENCYFFKKTDKDSKKTVAEIDFLIRRENKIIPIEAKSSVAESIKSLKLFKKTYSNKIGTQLILYDGDIKRNEEIIYLPYFMAFVI